MPYAVFISLELTSCWFFTRAAPGNTGAIGAPAVRLSLLSQQIESSTKVNKCWTIACNDEEDLNSDCWEGLKWRLRETSIFKESCFVDTFAATNRNFFRYHGVMTCKSVDAKACLLAKVDLCLHHLKGKFAGKWEIVSVRVARRPVKTGNWPIQSFLLLAAAS